MEKEEKIWTQQLSDFYNRPVDGLRGKGICRREVYINSDNQFRAIVGDYQRRKVDSAKYLRSISYHLPKYS